MSDSSLLAGREGQDPWPQPQPGGDPDATDAGTDTEMDWRDQAACRSTSPDLFFPVGATGTALIEIAAAKYVCSQCQVREACLEYALDTHQEYGVWGGSSEEERRILRRRRRQAASRSTAQPAS